MKNPYTKTREFAMTVEQIVVDENMSYMDALLYVMEKENLDEDTVAKLVKKNSVIKIKLELESEELNLLKSETGNTLPI